MNKKITRPVFTLDLEEQAISDAYDRGEYVPVKNMKKELAEARLAASNYLNKDARASVRSEQ